MSLGGDYSLKQSLDLVLNCYANGIDLLLVLCSVLRVGSTIEQTSVKATVSNQPSVDLLEFKLKYIVVL